MATFTLYEYQTVTPAGEPVQPPSVRTLACAFDAAVRLATGTLYYEAIPTVDARFRISGDGSAATAADQKIYADVGWAGHVDPHARPYLYMTAA